MKLAVLWDNKNPLTPVKDMVEALRCFTETREFTFDQVGHRTQPRGRFAIQRQFDQFRPDAVLWIEGGPFPGDLDSLKVLKACWAINAHLEPTLLPDMHRFFDIRLTTYRDQDTDSKWLPLSASGIPRPALPGLHFSGADPTPPEHIELAMACSTFATATPKSPTSVMLCPGQAGRPSANLLSHLASGAIVITDSCDLRDIAVPGEHILTYSNLAQLDEILREANTNPDVGREMGGKAARLVQHLHTPQRRAKRLHDYLWPKVRKLGAVKEKPTVSVLTCCYNYAKRFRCYLESLARQQIDGTLEIVVSDPQSPDGLKSLLDDFSNRWPHLQIVHLRLEREYCHNRGLCINRAFQASTADVIVSTDGDIIFPPHLLAHLVSMVSLCPFEVFGVRRLFLNKETTREILDGNLDPVQNFKQLTISTGDGEPDAREGVLGYCQALNRRAFAVAGYPEEYNMVNQSDIVFLDRLKVHAGMVPRFLETEAVLHLWHPRNWSGATEPL